ncbi:hypothetical protein BO70DRAFT_360317 [Aspergillus heteromorphus CBS 117.55]|uniref:A-kinase anchor protein 7-like phosphoesterase domain-containing protein n=1 Tax=Aspergillus heteromorphus CBS 117.55 TaxID=1448321 RepID=A0A317WRC9_9EURO|nr:uncharacterized protein BO70DRAFT_360317 [Aspergillus heteromorphus CBS 117.55]PWY87677.1 hypothetical protein BO70DRAFT_360317 [Aspergillus heteromorphus CBS 117.55]
MVSLRPVRPCISSWSISTSLIRSHPRHYETMSDRTARNPPQKKEKRPPLTHFLCLPLINPISLPQLESSLATFKAAIPPKPGAEQQTNPTLRELLSKQPLIPHGALRPVGTLHLTLGVMSLPTKDRLNEAINFLQSLDLVSMLRDAEKSANRPRGKRPLSPEAVEKKPCTTSQDKNIAVPSPFTISLESLHALPRAKAATVLHAAPVDTTSRLYPFCERLRDKFLEAGLLQGETKPDASAGEATSKPPPADGPFLPVEGPVEGVAESRTPNSPRSKREGKSQHVRPLLLHATIANTIYVKGKRRGGGGGGGQQGSKNHRSSQYTFDARDILAHYRDYYLDAERTVPRSGEIHVRESSNEDADLTNNSDSGAEAESIKTVPAGKKQKATPATSKPFVWARDFPIETVCICEMGAKKLDPQEDDDGLNARLGEKYRVVAERSLQFETPDTQEDEQGNSSDGSLEGGVQV